MGKLRAGFDGPYMESRGTTSVARIQSFSVAEGEVLAIQMLDGVDALLCDVGTNPRMYVEVFGYYTE